MSERTLVSLALWVVAPLTAQLPIVHQRSHMESNGHQAHIFEVLCWSSVQSLDTRSFFQPNHISNNIKNTIISVLTQWWCWLQLYPQLGVNQITHSALIKNIIRTNLHLSSSVFPSICNLSHSLSSSSFSTFVICPRIFPIAGILWVNQLGVLAFANSTPSKIAISANASPCLFLHKTSDFFHFYPNISFWVNTLQLQVVLYPGHQCLPKEWVNIYDDLMKIPLSLLWFQYLSTLSPTPTND